MVDFNNEATVATPAADVERISILQRRYELIDAYEDYKKFRFQGAKKDISLVRARLFSVFIQLQAALKRRWPPEKYKEALDKIRNSREEDDILQLIFDLNETLDEMKLTRIDTRKVYDSTDIEAENIEKGF